MKSKCVKLNLVAIIEKVNKCEPGTLIQGAITWFTKSMVTALTLKEVKTSDVAKTISNLATCYFELNNIDRAKELFNKSLTKYEDINDHGGLARAHNNVGLCCMEKHQYLEAIKHFEKSVELRTDQSLRSKIFTFF